MRKTTIWISSEDATDLRRIGREQDRSQSDLIRRGIAMIRALAALDRRDAPPNRWLTPQEEMVLSFTNAGWSASQIGLDIGISEADVLEARRSIDTKLDTMEARGRASETRYRGPDHG